MSWSGKTHDANVHASSSWMKNEWKNKWQEWNSPTYKELDSQQAWQPINNPAWGANQEWAAKSEDWHEYEYDKKISQLLETNDSSPGSGQYCTEVQTDHFAWNDAKQQNPAAWNEAKQQDPAWTGYEKSTRLSSRGSDTASDVWEEGSTNSEASNQTAKRPKVDYSGPNYNLKNIREDRLDTFFKFQPDADRIGNSGSAASLAYVEKYLAEQFLIDRASLIFVVSIADYYH